MKKNVFVFLCLVFITGCAGMGEIRKMTINDVDLAKVKDGVYRGGYSKARWFFELEITVESHKIKDIKILKSGARDSKFIKIFNDQLVQKALEKQSDNFDTVSGATINTIAFRKAMENALMQGLEK